MQLFPQLLGLVAALLFGLLATTARADILYHLVTGGEEVYQVEKAQSLNYLALTKGLRPWVLARQTKLKVNATLKPGTVLKIDTSHIVPTELSHGLVINLPELLLYQFHLGAYQRRYALAVGKPSWPTPTGSYQVLNKAENPVWTVPISIQEEMESMGQTVVEKVPPGPNNPLGKFWIGTSAEGVGIHATNRPWSVGHYVSHGCIRMLPEEIAQLFPQVEVGTLIKIIYQPVKMALTRQGRIYLEAHPNIYNRKINYLEYVRNLVQSYRLEDRVDWQKIETILKIKDGVAHDVTKEAPPTRSAATSPSPPKPRKLGLFPLHQLSTRIE
ncbi:MAG: L,D-transpeptidase [Desulfobaccales bacterium]